MSIAILLEGLCTFVRPRNALVLQLPDSSSLPIVWTAISVYGFLRRCRVSRDLSHASSIYHSNLHMSVRLFIFSGIQLSAIL